MDVEDESIGGSKTEGIKDMVSPESAGWKDAIEQGGGHEVSQKEGGGRKVLQRAKERKRGWQAVLMGECQLEIGTRQITGCAAYSRPFQALRLAILRSCLYYRPSYIVACISGLPRCITKATYSLKEKRIPGAGQDLLLIHGLKCKDYGIISTEKTLKTTNFGLSAVGMLEAGQTDSQLDMWGTTPLRHLRRLHTHFCDMLHPSKPPKSSGKVVRL
ncbi:hypothetical protein B0H14DRAFT_2616327 [Mycena olivaceomarginata]|nr:hypothetical protein B0H14DRAFT_2616327 [Mycena olivaceomarginata]